MKRCNFGANSICMGISNKIGAYLILLLISCNGLEEARIDPEFDYQPLKVGNFWEYQVVETNYFGESDAETQYFFIKDIITSHYLNEVGEQVFMVDRQKSPDQQNWEQEKAFTYRISKGALLRSLDNETTIPLIFPPTEGKIWDANAYNSQPENNYFIELLINYHLESWEGSISAKVVQSEEDDLITLRDHRYEVFVRGVGLVESYYEVLTYCSRNDCLGKQIIDSGRFVHLELINNG